MKEEEVKAKVKDCRDIKIHISTAFYRNYLLNQIIHYYEPMKIIWHPVIFESETEKIKWPCETQAWLYPLVIPDNKKVSNFIDIGYHKNNAFIRSKYVNDDDYYIFLDDDDMITLETIKAIKLMNDDIVFISLKRGYNISETVEQLKQYDTSTLIADPRNVFPGRISKQQLVIKGKILKECNFLEDIHFADGILAFWLKQHYEIRYEPKLYALFNFFEKERWSNEE